MQVVLVHRLIILVILIDFFFFLLHFLFNIHSLIGLSSFKLWCDHQNVIQGNNNWIIIIKLLGVLNFLGKKISILSNHLVDHRLDHAKIHHDVVLSKTLALLKLSEFLRSISIYHCKYGFNILLNLIDFTNSSPIL